MRAVGPIIAVLAVVALLISSALFTVDQRQNAIVFQLGEVKEVVNRSGLHFKWPLLQNVRHFDMRILTFDDAEPLRFLTQGNRPALVDSFVKWRISDVRQYYVSVQGDEFRAATRIKQTVSGVLRDEFGARVLHDVVSGERGLLMSRVREKVDQDLKRIGVEIIDVRLKRVDLPQDVSESVYRRMEAERKRIANELRSTGAFYKTRQSSFMGSDNLYAFPSGLPVPVDDGACKHLTGFAVPPVALGPTSRAPSSATRWWRWPGAWSRPACSPASASG